LILRKIIKIWATRCQILRLKCTKFDFGWGSPQTLLRELTALPQTPKQDLRRPTSNGREGREGKEGRGEGEGRGRGEGRKGREKGREGEGNGSLPPLKFRSGYATACRSVRTVGPYVAFA